MPDRETPRRPGDDVALTLIRDGERRDVTVRELTVSNKIAFDALLSVLAEKGLVEAAEVHARIRQLTSGHLRPGAPPPEPAPDAGGGPGAADPAGGPGADPGRDRQR